MTADAITDPLHGRPAIDPLASVTRTCAAILTARDIEMFARIGVPPALLEEAHIERVSDRDARQRFGIQGPVSRNMAGIVFPYLSHVTGQRVTARVRRDNPEIEDGKPKSKYVCAYGDGRHLYFPPRAKELLADAATPVVLVEAEKSVLALTAWAARQGRELLAVGLGGCWGWRGRIGKAVNATGERVDVLGPLPDLEVCNKRRVYVLLDANAAINSRVRAARTALVRELLKRECDIQVCGLPVIEGINGPDDYIGVASDAAMAKVLDSAVDSTRKTDETAQESKDEGGRVDIIAAALEIIEFGATHRETFYRLCVTLQKLRGDEAIILPVEKIGAALGCDWSLIARFRRQAVVAGWLRQTSPAIAHRKAAQFRVESLSGTPSADKNMESISPSISNHSHSSGTPSAASLVGHPASSLAGHPETKPFSGTPNPAESDGNELCEVII